ncbi:MAG: SdrD B-like domain-containing protein, partial [Candidatus Caldatribacteriota bacterium]|nr:SdrD B-like domain-containing protein [Candidatus Caldatribacteriota bacterium]
MKLSIKIILPIILISALLILLNGCWSVPSDESPGITTTGTGAITGIIAAPCCDTSGEPVSENSGSPEYWCYWCEKDWFIQDGQDGVEVILTSGQDEIATTTTDENGEYTFTGVDPGENYVITAYCPGKEIPLVMDVVPELA